MYRDNLDDNQQHNYFNTDLNFTNDTFTNSGGGVNDAVSAARNSSSANYRSVYYLNINPTSSTTMLFCVNPGSFIGVLGTKNDQASALRLVSGSSTACF